MDLFTVDSYGDPQPGLVMFDSNGEIAEVTKDLRDDRELTGASLGGTIYVGDLNGDGGSAPSGGVTSLSRHFAS